APDAADAAATSSNGLGLIGTIVGVTTNSTAAAGIGFYGAGIMVYRRLIRHGNEIIRGSMWSSRGSPGKGWANNEYPASLDRGIVLHHCGVERCRTIEISSTSIT
ncbi:MAG TPA: hypothetical protein VGM27_08045, partial [Acidobacteriaceae bacterium]